MQLLFDMFSTLLSSEVRFKVKTVMYGCNAGPPIPIIILVHSTTVLCDYSLTAMPYYSYHVLCHVNYNLYRCLWKTLGVSGYTLLVPSTDTSHKVMSL